MFTRLRAAAVPAHLRFASPREWQRFARRFSATSSSSASAGGRTTGFKAKGRVDGDGSGMSNPFADMHHLKQHHLIIMCLLCLTGGMAAGRFANIDEDELFKVRFEKDEMMEHFRQAFELRPDLAATCLRLAFVLAARRGGVTAEVVEESCSVADGLTDVSQALNYAQVRGSLTTEDAVAISVLAAVKFLRGPHEKIKFNYAREDLATPPPRRTPRINPAAKGDAPAEGDKAPLFSIPYIMKHIGGLTVAESVALMACHSVGEFHDEVSGIDGISRLPRRYTLTNAYYKALLQYQKEFKKLPVLRTKENESVHVLPTDFVSAKIKDKQKNTTVKCAFSGREVAQQLKDPEWLKWVEAFAKDRELWEDHFAAAMQKLLDSNHRTKLRDYEADWRRTHNIPADAPPATAQT